MHVIPKSPPFILADDEESRSALEILRARFLAPLGMTFRSGFSNRLYRGEARNPTRPSWPLQQDPSF